MADRDEHGTDAATRDAPSRDGGDATPGGRDYTPAEQGDSATTNPSAPPSSGRPHGSGGVVDPGHGSDLRPVDSDRAAAGRAPGEPLGHGETPVPHPAGGSSPGGGSGTASAGAASVAAGGEPPADAEGELGKRERVRSDSPGGSEED